MVSRTQRGDLRPVRLGWGRTGHLRPAALSLLALFVTACQVHRELRHPNLLLVTLEATRADHLGTYGYSRPTSPRFDRLAQQGALFEQAYSVSPRTNPSLASLMTSLYPHEHGVRSLFRPLAASNHTLAEILQENGYATGAIQTHSLLKAASGFAQGFDTYDDAFIDERRADEACLLADRWIRRANSGRRPWFLWLHLVDPHWPYEPPRSVRSLFGPEDPRTLALYKDLAAKRVTMGSVIFQNRMPTDEVASFVSLYDGEIRFADDALGSLLDALKANGLAEGTVLVITADHGESLGEHDYFFEHGDFGTEPEIHVPMLFVAPGLVPAGIRPSATVRTLDVAPTILDLLGLRTELQFRGVSLLPLLRGSGAGEDRTCFGEVDEKYHDENTRREVEGVAGKWRWMRRGRYKLLYVPRASGSLERRLYDLATDPGETHDLSRDYPVMEGWLARDLESWVTEGRVAESGGGSEREMYERLRSLGYIN